MLFIQFYMMIPFEGLYMNILRILVACVLFVLLPFNAYSTQGLNFNTVQHGFPRLMGMNIGKKHYSDPVYRYEISKVDVLILGFYPGWGRYKGENGEKTAVEGIKKLNKHILVGQYTIMNEAPDANNMKSASRDVGEKIDQEGWWLRDVDGRRTQWTDKYNNWDVNISSYVEKDADGLYFPQWKARRDYKIFFQNNSGLNIWYLDNALSKSPVKLADWNHDGRNDENFSPEIAKQFRLANVAEWNEIRKLHPGVLLLGNSDDVSSPEYQGQLNGVFMEALIGRSWSMEKWKGWERVMRRYRLSMRYTRSPHLVGFNVWGKHTDYQRMRYGLMSCLLGDGYFSYTDENKPYASVPRFDEYEIELGQPLDTMPKQAWSHGVYRRFFEKGMVLVNPNNSSRTVKIESGYSKFLGKQDSKVNNGMRVSGELTLKAKDGIILVRTELLN